MIKVIAAVARRPGMTSAEFFAYIQNVHGSITADNPLTIHRYVQNHVYDGAFGAKSEKTHSQFPSRDCITELYFEDADALKSTFTNNYVKKVVGPDGQNFSDEANALSIVVEEYEQKVINPSKSCGGKVVQFLRAKEGLELNEFFERWCRAHTQALTMSPLAAATLRRCIHQHQLPQFNEMLSYFGGKDIPIYEGAASLWYDDMSTVGAFRAYEQVLQAINDNPDTAFYQPEQSFFVYVREVPIYAKNK